MEQLRTVFLDALNPNKETRTKAENVIKSYQTQPGFLLQLPSFFLDQDMRIRKISTIIFKNTVICGWKDPNLANQKTNIMGLMLEIIKITDKSTVNDIEDTLKYILKSEDVENWKVMVDKAELYIKQREDAKALFSSLLFYKNAFKCGKIQYKQENSNMLIAPIVNDLLPALCHSCKTKTYYNVDLVIKILISLLESYVTESPLDEINMFVQIYQTICDILQIEESTKEVLVTKKNCVKFLHKLFTKAFRSTLHNQEIKVFVLNQSHFLYCYNIILETIRKEILRVTEFTVEKDKILRECASFLSTIATEGKRHCKVLLNDLKFLIFDFIYPLHLLTEDIEDNFEENPKSYIRERYDYYATDAKGHCLVLFTEIVRLLNKERAIFNAMIKEFIDILNVYQMNPNKQNACNKFACVHLLSSISDHLPEDMTNFITSYIIPDLNSPHIFLRSQSSYALQFYSSEFVDSNAIRFALENTINNSKNENIVVKADSILSITFFFSNESIQDTFKQYIPYFIQCLLDLQKNNELEAINDVLESTISNYSNEIQSHAPELVTCLCNLINKEREKIKSSTEQFDGSSQQAIDEDKILLFSGYLRTINELIIAKNIQKELSIKLYFICYETLCGIFKDRIEDLFSEALGLFSDFVYTIKYVDDSMWNLFIITMSIDKDDKLTNADEFVYLIDNFVSFGSNNIKNYLKIILNYIEILCNPDDGSFYDDEHINACQIIDSLFTYCKENCIEYIPFFIDCITNYYDAFDSSTNIFVYYIEVLMDCFIADFNLTHRKLLELGKLNSFIEDFYNNYKKFTRVNDKKKILLFMMDLMLKNEDLQTLFDIKILKKILLKTIETLPAAIEKKKKYAENDYPDDNDEDEINDLEEDYDYESPLDNINVFEMFRNVCNNLGLFGVLLINVISEKEKEKIKKILDDN